MGVGPTGVDCAVEDKRLREIEGELARIDGQINALQRERKKWDKARNALLAKRQARERALERKKNEERQGQYASESFPWSQQLRNRAEELWGITAWRGQQLAVMNASLDGRDTFVIMPTGGGKSLCYQLPALMRPGVTLVISPLLSLIQDQVFQLEDLGIPVAAMTSGTPKEKVREVTLRLSALAKSAAREPVEYPRLLYVTPEKIAKSKRFLSLLEKLYSAGLLQRIVIDECHCCSEFGHDFRPDYKKLGVLRITFPKAPIMALTATCSPRVVKSVIKVVGLKETDEPNGTLLYVSPLWRPNLEYQVLPKAASAKDQIARIAGWIEDNYPRDRGIIYCLTKKETEAVALGVREASGGSILAQPYHADLEDEDKHRIHADWRDGRVLVVVATIAFGMGINQPDVRFVLHHSCSKSVEGYYQESGRAGRDGLPAKCVLFYRGADFSRLTSWGVTDAGEGLLRARTMVRYAEDLTTCRKLWMEAHFQQPTSMSFDADEQEQRAEARPCGNCDHCVAAQSTPTGSQLTVTADVTPEAVTLINILDGLARSNQKVTFLKLLDVWVGRGLKAYPVISRLREAELVQIPPNKRYNEFDRERLLNHLLLEGFLDESFHFTAYSTISYIVVGQRGASYIGIRAEDLPLSLHITMAMPSGGGLDLGAVPAKSSPKKARKVTTSGGVNKRGTGSDHSRQSPKRQKKAAGMSLLDLSSSSEDNNYDNNGGGDDDDFDTSKSRPLAAVKQGRPTLAIPTIEISEDEDN